MKSQTLILLVVAASCGLVAMFGVQRVLNDRSGDTGETTQVLVAAVDLSTGQPLDDMNTKFITVSQDVCPPGVVTSLEQIKERALKVPAVSGDWILQAKLTEPGETGAVATIPKGMRAATIQVDATTSHSGMLRPGNRVDVLLTWQDVEPSGLRRQKVKPLLEYVEVFAVDDKVVGINKDGGGVAKTISLLVTPEQASLLQLARTKGELSTTLRSNGDADETQVAELSDESLESFGARTPRDVSALDVQEGDGEPAFELPQQETVLTQLEKEWNSPSELPFASGPLPAAGLQVAAVDPEQIWKIAIHENGSVRVENVKLNSDEPVDTRSPEPPAATKPDSDPVWNLDESLDGGLEQAATGLLDLLN